MTSTQPDPRLVASHRAGYVVTESTSRERAGQLADDAERQRLIAMIMAAETPADVAAARRAQAAWLARNPDDYGLLEAGEMLANAEAVLFGDALPESPAPSSQDEPRAETAAKAASRVLGVVLFSDIVDSSGRKLEMGDSAWRVRLEKHDAAVRRLIDEFGGRYVKHTGDGFLAMFSQPSAAAACAQAVRDAVRDMGMTSRLGLHLGEYEAMGDDAIGTAVDTAARVMHEAEPNEILVTETLHQATAGSRLPFGDPLQRDLRGIGRWQLYPLGERPSRDRSQDVRPESRFRMARHSMTEADVLAMVARGESETIEFKKSLGETREALHTLAALASQGGGTVTFGISPQGKVVGVTIGANSLENLATAIASTIQPQLFPSIDHLQVEGTTVITVTVTPDGQPYTADGRFYRRVGRVTHPAPLSEYLRQLLPFRPDLQESMAAVAYGSANGNDEASTWHTYVNGRFGFSVRFPSDWPRGQEADNGDGIRFYDGEPTALISAFASHYAIHSVPYHRAGQPGFRTEPFKLDDGTDARLIVGSEAEMTIRDMVVIARGVEFHVYAQMSEAFYRTNDLTILRVMKGLQILHPPFSSGGLGLSRIDWEHLHGRPVRDEPFAQYENGSMVATFMDGNLWRLERIWGDFAAVELDVARDGGQRLIPSDARLVRTYSTTDGRTVDLYKSESLGVRFPDSRWTGGEAGDFIVLYRIRGDGLVTSLVAATGNNP